MVEHAVLVHLKLPSGGLGSPAEVSAIHALSSRLEATIDQSGVGELDGDEFGEGECVLFMYGPDADALYAAIEPELRASSLSRGGWVIKRYGAAEDRAAKEERVEL